MKVEAAVFAEGKKTSADILMRKQTPWQMFFCHGFFCFLYLMIPEIDFFAISVYIGITYGTNGMILMGQFHNWNFSYKGDEMTVQELKDRKKKMGMTNSELAERSGVPLSTVAKVLGGTTQRPRIDTIRALEAALFGERSNDTAGLMQQEGVVMEAGDSYIYGSNAKKEESSRLHSSEEEESVTGNSKKTDIPQNGGIYGHEIRMGHGAYTVESTEKRSTGMRAPLYTIEDYLALPDERRVEMIDGRFYDLAAPGGIHQQIVMRLWKKLDDCIEEHGMSCSAQASPFDVQLDDYTIVQPDVMVFCRDPLQVYADRATAAPDLVIEVLSKSTAFRDRHLKLFKYQRAGVREVWLVSPEKRGVEVYLFERNTEEPERYTFDDKVPVHISDGRCSIDFADIHRKLADYLS